ncbi:hypothetical protein GMA12_16610 [Kocuria sediminis]|uniref:Uncharacterized protein n=1 Tax=Kocuria sediminis TaxID=1038857 RepID=A0A6N8GRD9_9MICC|nr:hypothetical protein [Kocuria sediminis]MUN64742.1 hypothetical protein [Kocuria sediminis]
MDQYAQHRPVTGPPGPVPSRDGVRPAAPLHCGAPMPVRLLDFADVDDRLNSAVARAALAGRRLHACACGTLQDVPATSGAEGRIVPDGDAVLFRPFFTRRVLAAAGRVEAAEWSLDQQLAGFRTLDLDGAGGPAAVLRAFGAAVRSERRRLDRALGDLGAELRLATRHGVPLAVLVREASLSEQDLVAALALESPQGVGAARTAPVADVQGVTAVDAAPPAAVPGGRAAAAGTSVLPAPVLLPASAPAVGRCRRRGVGVLAAAG